MCERETCIFGKRPIYMKRDLYVYEKRPMCREREAFSYERERVEVWLTGVRERPMYK